MTISELTLQSSLTVVNVNTFCYTIKSIVMAIDIQKNSISRPPVVVIMGHIDHGKSTLLDYIRKTNIVAGEAGGITQHVGTYQAEYVSSEGKKNLITFLDTPGHAAFSGIRERGAKVADIAILIVSAEDGVKPQTVEAYKDIVAGKIPYVVAITKIDKANANVDKAKQSLGENEVYVEGWGGDVPCVAISSVTGEGIPELLDMVMLVADMAGFKTDPSAPTTGVIIESTLDTRKGISATLLVKDGTLNIGTFVVADGAYAPVRFIENFNGDKIDFATASMPANILGWNIIPTCGAKFITVKTKKEAEKIVGEFESNRRRAMQSTISASTTQVSAQKNTQTENGDATISPIITLPLIIKADVIGSLEGVKHEIAKISHEKVQPEIVAEGIGSINENDVKMVQGDHRIILLGFNAAPDKKASSLIERSPVPLNVKSFSIIYELSAYVEEALTALIPKEFVEEMTGQAKILALFSKEKDRQVVGGKVLSGTISNNNEVRIMRRDTELCRGRVRELQSKKLRVTEVAEGFEFGMMVEAKLELAVGDKIEAVRTVEKI